MKAIAWTVGVAGALMVWSTTADAKEFGEQGTFAFGVDRVFGFYLTKRDIDNGAVEESRDINAFSFAMTANPPPSVYALPRLGFDYFVIDHLSIGGSFGFSTWSSDGERTNPNGNRNNLDEIDTTSFLISPRVGYGVMFSDVVGIWPRGGFTYYSVSNDVNNDDFNEHAFALTLECPLLILPLEHLGIEIGPALDIGLTGKQEDPNPNDPDWDLTLHSFGFVAAGMFGWL